MFPSRFFPARYFAPRYFPRHASVVVVVGEGGGMGKGYARRLPDVLDLDDDALAILLITEILLND